MDPRAGLDVSEESKIYYTNRESKARLFSPEPGQYVDYTVLAVFSNKANL